MSNGYEEPLSLQTSSSDYYQNAALFTDVKNSLHSSDVSLSDEMEVQKDSSSASLTMIHDSKTLQKSLHLIRQSPRRGNTIIYPIMRFYFQIYCLLLWNYQQKLIFMEIIS